MASVGHVVVGMAAARFSRHREVTTWTPFGAAALGPAYHFLLMPTYWDFDGRDDVP